MRVPRTASRPPRERPFRRPRPRGSHHVRRATAPTRLAADQQPTRHEPFIHDRLPSNFGRPHTREASHRGRPRDTESRSRARPAPQRRTPLNDSHTSANTPQTSSRLSESAKGSKGRCSNGTRSDTSGGPALRTSPTCCMSIQADKPDRNRGSKLRSREGPHGPTPEPPLTTDRPGDLAMIGQEGLTRSP